MAILIAVAVVAVRWRSGREQCAGGLARVESNRGRLDFANDPRNLHAVDPKVNFDKAFRDAAHRCRPDAAFRCDLVARQVAVKAAYRLWVSAKTGNLRLTPDDLDRCGGVWVGPGLKEGEPVGF